MEPRRSATFLGSDRAAVTFGAAPTFAVTRFRLATLLLSIGEPCSAMHWGLQSADVSYAPPGP
jgi:hypothetical protein